MQLLIRRVEYEYACSVWCASEWLTCRVQWTLLLSVISISLLARRALFNQRALSRYGNRFTHQLLLSDNRNININISATAATTLCTAIINNRHELTHTAHIAPSQHVAPNLYLFITSDGRYNHIILSIRSARVRSGWMNRPSRWASAMGTFVWHELVASDPRAMSAL